MATKFGELIWIALQNWRADLDTSPNWELVSSPTKSSWICKLYESVGSQSGLCWESVMSLSVVCQKSDGNQIWRADLDSSPKLESWFGHLSKLRTGVTSNKKLRWVNFKRTFCFVFNFPKEGMKNFCPRRLGQKLTFSSLFFGRIEGTKISFQD